MIKDLEAQLISLQLKLRFWKSQLKATPNCQASIKLVESYRADIKNTKQTLKDIQ